MDVSAAAVSKARQKLPTGCFKTVLQTLVTPITGERRIYAVDGSKVHISPKFVHYGFKPRTNLQPVPRPARRPICMLSSLVDVHSQCCYDFDISSHFNERKSASKLFQSVRPKDVVLFDRGYYSKDIVSEMLVKGIDFVMRLKCDAFKGVKTFLNSAHTTAKVWHPQRRLNLLKYTIDGKKYVCLSSLDIDGTEVKALYHKRWKVEDHFKRMKSYLNIEYIRSYTPSMYCQEIELRVLLDALSQLQEKEANSSSSVKQTSSVLRLHRLSDTLFKKGTCQTYVQVPYSQDQRRSSKSWLGFSIEGTGLTCLFSLA